MKTLLKVVIALVAVAVLAALFIRSATSTGSQPFPIAREHLVGWTLMLPPENDPLGSAPAAGVRSSDPGPDDSQ